MFKPGEMILYHLPYHELPPEKRMHGPQSRPFLVVQAWPNEYGPGKHGYNGILFLDGTNDAQRDLNIVGKTSIQRYDQLPVAYGYSVPEGDGEGMVSATPNQAEETAALPPQINVSGWGTQIPGAPRQGASDGRHRIKLLLNGQTLAGYVTTEKEGVLTVEVDGEVAAQGSV